MGKPDRPHYRRPVDPDVRSSLPGIPVIFPSMRRWRGVLRRHGISTRVIQLLSRCRQRKACSWLDLDTRDLSLLMVVGVVPPLEISLVPRAGTESVDG